MSSIAKHRQQSMIRDWYWSVDKVSVLAVGLLIIIGLLLSLASSPGAADRRDLIDPFYYLSRHLIFAGLAAGSVFVISMFSRQNARRLAFLALLCALLVMIYIEFFGNYTAGEAKRWIRVGSFTLQPSEFLKPGLMVMIAWLLVKSQQTGIPGRLIAFAVYGFSSMLLLLQPDAGQTILITMSFVLVFFIAGMSWQWVVSFISLTVIGSIGVYLAMPHFASRINRFLDSSSGDNHQVNMAMAAIQRGGVFGRGPGEGRIKSEIPDAHTDFIFSVAAEEFGMILCVIIIGLYTLIVVRSMMRASRLIDPVSQLSAIGLAVLLGLQAFINIGVNLQMLPTTGMTLPFISYGGSSMLAIGLTVGLLLAFTRSRPGVME
ncbi:MAG: putative lipid II flippase FtsW [Robiginitomaculum sp.]|nr:putative lipid II flippase FtsW [Robiginitomaculum sp.]